MRQISVYVASKRRHAEKIKAARVDGIHLNARWLDSANLAANAAKPASHWQRENFNDIRDAEAVLVYAEKGERLVNGLLEVGYALAYGKPVYCVGSKDPSPEEGASPIFMHPDYEPWCRSNPEGIFRTRDFGQTFLLLLSRARGEAYSLSHEGLTPAQQAQASRIAGSETRST